MSGSRVEEKKIVTLFGVSGNFVCEVRVTCPPFLFGQAWGRGGGGRGNKNGKKNLLNFKWRLRGVRVRRDVVPPCAFVCRPVPARMARARGKTVFDYRPRRLRRPPAHRGRRLNSVSTVSARNAQSLARLRCAATVSEIITVPDARLRRRTISTTWPSGSEPLRIPSPRSSIRAEHAGFPLSGESNCPSGRARERGRTANRAGTARVSRIHLFIESPDATVLWTRTVSKVLWQRL